MEVASNLIGAPTNRAVPRDRNGIIQIQKAANSKNWKIAEKTCSNVSVMKSRQQLNLTSVHRIFIVFFISVVEPILSTATKRAGYADAGAGLRYPAAGIGCQRRSGFTRERSNFVNRIGPSVGKIERGYTPEHSFALTRPKLGFELSPRKKMSQTLNTRSISKVRKFSRHLGNIGSGALRALDNLRDFNRFRSPFLLGNMA